MSEGICRECGEDLDDRCQCSLCEGNARAEYVEQLQIKDDAWLEQNNEHARKDAEITRLKIELEVMESCAQPQGPGLCGHPAEYSYSPDGKGKRILCLQCQKEKAEGSLTRIVDELQAMMGQRDFYASKAPFRY